MKRTLVLVVDDEIPLPANDALIVHWDGRQVPHGQISLTERMESRLLEIRALHMDWAYNKGFIDVGGRSLQKELECGATPSMWWTSLIYERHPRLSPHLYAVYKICCLEQLLLEEPCDHLRLFGGDAKLKKTLASLCRAKKMKFSHRRGRREKKPFISLLKTVYDLTPAVGRALIRYCHWGWTIRRKLGAVPSLQNPPAGDLPPPATIATYFPNIDLHEAAHGRFRSRYWESLHGALNREARWERPDGPHFVRWLFIRFPAPNLSLEQCLKLRDLFQEKGEDGLSFNYLEEFLSFGDCCKAFWRWLCLVFASFKTEAHFASNCVFLKNGANYWPYFRREWAESFRGWRALERCLQNFAFQAYYRMAGKQRWSLFPLENCPWERMLTEASHRQHPDSPVIGAQHSTVRPTDFRYFDAPATFVNPDCSIFQPDIIAGNGSSACSQWLEAGMPPKRLKEAEALRYLYLNDMRKENMGENAALPAEPGEPVEPPGSPRLLVFTSFFKDETHALLALLEQGLNAGCFPDWRIIIKPHPYLPVEDWLAKLQAPLRRQITVVDTPIAMLLKNDASVWAANSTTAALEAALMKMPLMVMLADNDFDLCPIQNISGLLRTGSLADLRHAIKNLKPVAVPPDYLDLQSGLKAWKKLLGLNFPEE